MDTGQGWEEEWLSGRFLMLPETLVIVIKAALTCAFSSLSQGIHRPENNLKSVLKMDDWYAASSWKC